MLDARLRDLRVADPPDDRRAAWFAAAQRAAASPEKPGLATNAQASGDMAAMCAAGILPCVRRAAKDGRRMEQGCSRMGCEGAGAMGIAPVAPEKDVAGFVGDGGCMTAPSEPASVSAASWCIPFAIVPIDDRRPTTDDRGCISRRETRIGGIAQVRALLPAGRAFARGGRDPGPALAASVASIEAGPGPPGTSGWKPRSPSAMIRRPLCAPRRRDARGGPGTRRPRAASWDRMAARGLA